MDHVKLKNQLYLNQDVERIAPKTTLSDDKRLIKFAYEEFSNTGYASYLCVICNNSEVVSEVGEGVNYTYVSQNGEHIYCCSCWTLILSNYTTNCVIEKDMLLDKIAIKNDTRLANIFFKMMLKCKWPNCNKIYYYYNLKKHEMECEYQAKYRCPVKPCDFNEQLRYYEEHFKSHPKCKLVFDNKIIHPVPGTDYYFVFADVIIELKYRMEEMGDVYKHFVAAKHCTTNCTMKPLLFLSDRSVFLGSYLGSKEPHVAFGCSKQIAIAVSFSFP